MEIGPWPLCEAANGSRHYRRHMSAVLRLHPPD